MRRDGSERTVQARTAEVDGRTVIGVSLRLDYDLPVDVTINTGSVGGPSAGLMFSLAIYDVLTPGELTGARDIAGTGTMEDDGSVGPIGGIRQKLVGARAAGADYFLAPAENCDEVIGHVPDGLRVVRVATFDEGLGAVEAIEEACDQRLAQRVAVVRTVQRDRRDAVGDVEVDRGLGHEGPLSRTWAGRGCASPRS